MSRKIINYILQTIALAGVVFGTGSLIIILWIILFG